MYACTYLAIAFTQSSEQYLEPDSLFTVNENPLKKVLLYFIYRPKYFRYKKRNDQVLKGLVENDVKLK